MKESVLTAQILSYARGGGCFAVKWYGSVYGSGGMPDVFSLVPSVVPSKSYPVPVLIEVKTPGNKPTPRQSKVLRDLRKVGAVAFWTDNLSEVAWVLEILRGGQFCGFEYAASGRLRL